MKKFLLLMSLILLMAGCEKTSLTDRGEFDGVDIPAINDIPPGEAIACTDWYWVTYDNQGIIHSMEFIETTCASSGGLRPEPLNDPAPNKGVVTKLDENLNGLVGLCPESIKFKKVIDADEDGGGWQIAAISGMKLDYVDQITKTTFRINLPVIYFGMPIVAGVGTNDPELITPERAQDRTGRIIQDIGFRAFDYFNKKGGARNPDAVANVSQYYREQLDLEMSKYGGKATLNAGLNISVTPTKAKYAGLMNIFCLN